MSRSSAKNSKKWVAPVSAGVGLLGLILAVQVFNYRIELVDSPYRQQWLSPVRSVASYGSDMDMDLNTPWMSYLRQTEYRPVARWGQAPNAIEQALFGELGSRFEAVIDAEKIKSLRAMPASRSPWNINEAASFFRKNPHVCPYDFAQIKIDQTKIDQTKMVFLDDHGQTTGWASVEVNSSGYVEGIKFQ